MLYLAVSLQSMLLMMINIGYHVSAHVLLNSFNKLGKGDLLTIFIIAFCNKCNKVNNTSAQMLGSIYHTTLKLL